MGLPPLRPSDFGQPTIWRETYPQEEGRETGQAMWLAGSS